MKRISSVTILVVLVAIAIGIAVLATNYYHGKRFHRCPECAPNKYYLVGLPLPPAHVISHLLDAIKTSGGRLNPELNFNNAKGKKLNAIQISKLCPGVADWFLSQTVARITSEYLGEKVEFAPVSEQYRIFARLYEDKDDFLDWHYDNNFTRGNRYTLVVPLIVDNCNSSEFQYMDRKSGEVATVKVPIGKGVLYNGSEVYHRITAQTMGCRRMVVIIPLYTDYSKSVIGEAREKLRNLTYQQLTL